MSLGRAEIETSQCHRRGNSTIIIWPRPHPNLRHYVPMETISPFINSINYPDKCSHPRSLLWPAFNVKVKVSSSFVETAVNTSSKKERKKCPGRKLTAIMNDTALQTQVMLFHLRRRLVFGVSLEKEGMLVAMALTQGDLSSLTLGPADCGRDWDEPTARCRLGWPRCLETASLTTKQNSSSALLPNEWKFTQNA